MMIERIFPSLAARLRLAALSDLAEAACESAGNEIDSKRAFAGDVRELGDRLGRAGFLGSAARRRMLRLRIALLAACPAAALFVAAVRSGGAFHPAALIGALGAGLYLAVCAWVFFLRSRERDFEREVLFRLPLFLESLMLVVESGMAVLPALESVISRRERVSRADPVAHIFGVAYRLASRGIPLETALELVAGNVHVRALRHVLLHLDISANAGGELVPSLRSLSDHAHLEWKLSVEQRVRRLENLVVFPVFGSVIGLILLTAAVPLVPLLDLHSTLAVKEERLSTTVRRPQ